ncbi:MAG: hypothetical protein QM754_08090 [Tepidisphaeraceae bacterium]
MTDDEIIRRGLVRFDRRRRWLTACRIVLTSVAIAGGSALAAALIDRGANLPPVVRSGVLAVLGIELAAGTLIAATLLFRRRFDAVRVARVIEANDAAWAERLSTVVTQAEFPAARRASAELLRVLTRQVAAETRERPPAKLVGPLLVWPGVMAVLLVAIAWAGANSVAALELPQLVSRQFRPYAGVSPVTTTKIAVLPHAMTIPQGEPLTITADVAAAAGPVTIDIGPDLARTRALQMRPEGGDRFTVTLLAVQQDFVYRIHAGDAATDAVSVRVSRMPGVSELMLSVVSSSGELSAPISFDDGVAYVPAGAECELSIHVTEPLSQATIRLGNRDMAMRSDGEGRVLAGQV